MVARELDEDGIEEDDVTPAPIFRRGFTSTGSFVRLSTAIRRSLRLPSRRISRDHRPPKISKTEPSDGPFSACTDLRLKPSNIPSRLDEIKDNKRLNREEKLKKLIRKGDWPVTHEIRKHLWILLCSDKNYDSLKGVFERKMVEENSIIGRSRKPMFIKEEGTVINNFDLNEEGAVRLLRLLSIVENDHPTMTSAPVLYPLCALLLHYMSDADSYACVEFLLRKRHYVHREARRRDAEDEIAHPRERAADPRSHCSFLNYVCKSNREWFASAHTILALVKKHKPNAYALLKRRCGTNDEDVLAETMRDWLRWIFAGLPMAHAVRVIDCFLVEGQKFIIRAGIAIVYIWSKAYKSRRLDELMGKSGAERISDVKEELWQTAKTLEISTDTFIEVCVSIRNLKGVTIARLQQEFEKKVAGEVERRESQKRARAPLPLYTDVFQSVIVDPEVAVYIMQALPARLQLSTPELLFRLSRDGASFTQLWTKVDEAEQSLIIIRSTSGEIFGAYCSACWAERNDRKERTKSKYFGTGESFVWKIDQSDEAQLPIIYRWVGAAMDHPDSCPQMFMAANDKLLLIGSGGGDAIRISEELSHGMSSNCSTFESPPLVKDNSFYIHELEVFGVTA